MAVAAAYGKLILSLFEGTIDVTGDSFKAMLLTDAHVPDQDVHQFGADVSADQTTGAGYTAGGADVTNVTVTYDAATNTATLRCDSINWPATTFDDVQYLVLYDSTSDALLAYVDYEVVQTTDNQPFTHLVSSNGFITFTMV